MIQVYFFILLGLLTLFGQLQLIISESSEVSIQCDLTRNEIWKERRGKCRKCKECYAQTGRDLNNIPVNFPKGHHGYTKCLKCNYCPAHFYARNSICQPCSADKCSKLNRYTHTECSLDDDVICSSTCLEGFHSEYGENDYKFPCAPDITTTNAPTTNRTTLPLKLIVTTEQTEIPEVNFEESNLKSSLPEGQKTEHYIWLAVVIGIAAVAFVVSVGLSVYVVRRCRRSRCEQQSDKRKNVSLDPSSTTKLLPSRSTLSNDNDLETDCQREYVRGELPRSITEKDLPFGEKTEETETTKDPVVCIKLQTQAAMFTKTICHCTKETCEMCFKDYIDIIVDIDMIGIVANNVCHQPEGMFLEQLGIPSSVLFSKNDDRNRDVENISEAEYITQILLYWTRSHQNATLVKLSKALCNQGFHHINDLLYTHHCKINLHPKIHKRSSIKCMCSIQQDCDTCQTKFPEGSFGDDFCDIITTNLCHRPETLFLDLGILDNGMCAKNCGNDKDRHVFAREHQKTMFKNWVNDRTIKPKSTLTEVAKMLCKHGYHHINDKLYQHYCKSYPSTIVTIPESSLYNEEKSEQNNDNENHESFEYLPSARS